jgi:hypothetical protein
MRSSQRDHPVTAEVEGLSQPGGTSISASTNDGFRSPFGDPAVPSVGVASEWWWCADPAKVSPWVFPCEGACFVVRFSPIDARGVGQRASPGDGDFSSDAFGVGHNARRVWSVSVPWNPAARAVVPLPEPIESFAGGVAHSPREEPEPVAFVGCANLGRGEQTPFRIEPEVGKTVEDFGAAESNKLRCVLQHDVSGSHLIDDPRDLGPEPAGVVNSTLLPGGAEWLAWETGSDEIHSATPRAAVEGCEIVPYRCLIQGLFCHAGHEVGRRVAFPLNVTYGSYVTSGDSECEFPSVVSGAEMQGT